MNAAINIPKFLTRYYVSDDNPFTSLNDLPLEQANQIKLMHCHRNNIGDFYAQDDYLVHRAEIEKWIHQQLILKGGHSTNTTPVYMTLGESPNGQFDIRRELQKNAAEFRIPLDVIDLSAVTFTFPDSMYKITLDQDGNIIGGGRTNTPEVYVYSEMEHVIKKYKHFLNDHYIEAQVWNKDMLNSYYRSVIENRK